MADGTCTQSRAFADFRIIPDVFSPAECEQILDDIGQRETDPYCDDPPTASQRRYRAAPGMTYTTTDDEPAWAAQRLVNIADAMNSTFWHVDLGAYPKSAFIRMMPGGCMAPHDDSYEYGKNPGVVFLAYLSGPDDYEGGELMLYGIPEPMRVPLGSVVVLPTDVAHAVAPVHSGDRWTMSKVFMMRGEPPVDPLTRRGPGIAKNMSDLVQSFATAAWAMGWNTHLQSTGRCWFIAAAWARRLYDAGVPYEIVRLENPDADHPAAINHAVVKSEGGCWDWSSRGGHEPDADSAPWPRLASIEHYTDQGYTPVPTCPTCGKAPHDGTCAPPSTLPTAATGTRREPPHVHEEDTMATLSNTTGRGHA